MSLKKYDIHVSSDRIETNPRTGKASIPSVVIRRMAPHSGVMSGSFEFGRSCGEYFVLYLTVEVGDPASAMIRAFELFEGLIGGCGLKLDRRIKFASRYDDRAICLREVPIGEDYATGSTPREALMNLLEPVEETCNSDV